MKRQFYACQTLLGGPDVNRRSLYFTDGHGNHTDAFMTFNGRMTPWTKEDSDRLREIIRLLNEFGDRASPGIVR